MSFNFVVADKSCRDGKQGSKHGLRRIAGPRNSKMKYDEESSVQRACEKGMYRKATCTLTELRERQT